MNPELSSWDHAVLTATNGTSVSSIAAESAEYPAPLESLVQTVNGDAIRINAYEIPTDKLTQIQELVSQSSDGRLSLEAMRGVLNEDPQFQNVFTNLEATLNFVSGNPELEGDTIEGKLSIGVLDGHTYATPIIEVTGGANTPPKKSIIITIDRKDEQGNVIGIEDAIFIDDDGEAMGVQISVMPLHIVDRDGNPLMNEDGTQKVQSLAFKSFTNGQGETNIFSVLSMGQEGDAIESPILTATITAPEANIRGIDPSQIIGKAQAGDQFMVVAGATPAPDNLGISGNMYSIMLPSGEIAMLSEQVMQLDPSMDISPQVLDSLLSIDPAEFTTFPLTSLESEMTNFIPEADVEMSVVQADYDRAYNVLPAELVARVELPEDDPAHIEYSQSLGGFVDSEGRVWRREVSRGNSETKIEQGWCIELDRETFHLVDKNGTPFTWTITFERVSTEGIGKTQAGSAQFTDEFGLLLSQFASRYLLADGLDGTTYHITYVPKYDKATDEPSTNTYLQEIQTLSNRNTYIAYGMNTTDTDQYFRMYNASNYVRINKPAGNTDTQVDESYASEDIGSAIRAIKEMQEGQPLIATWLFKVRPDTTQVILAMIPNHVNITGDFSNSTKLIDLSED